MFFVAKDLLSATTLIRRGYLLQYTVLREQNKMSLFWAKTRLFEVKHPLCKMLERSFFGRVPTFYTEDA